MTPDHAERLRLGSRPAFQFYAIAFALAVLVALAAPGLGEASLLVTMFTPAVAVAIMLIAVAPGGGLRAALSGLGLDRAGLKGWPFAVAGPVVIHLAGLTILVLCGLSTLARPDIAVPAVVVMLKVATGIVAATLFALAEEVGWRGYMLPRMAAWGTVPAMLLVGLLHGVWHLPLMLTTDYYHSAGSAYVVVPLFLVTLSLAGIFYGFLRLWTGSVWPVAIAHAAANMAWEIAGEVSRADSALAVEYVGGESGLVMIGGLLAFGFAMVRYMRRAGLRL